MATKTKEKSSANGHGGTSKDTGALEKVIHLPTQEVQVTTIRVVSRPGSSLIVNRVPERILDELQAKQMGIKINVKRVLSPELLWWEAPYHVDVDGKGLPCEHCAKLTPMQMDGDKFVSLPPNIGVEGLPGAAFKNGVEESFVKGKTEAVKKLLKQAVLIPAEVVPIRFDPKDRFLRRHHVRQEKGGLALAFRVEYLRWEADVPVEFMPEYITIDQLVAQFNEGGRLIGAGCWKPGGKKSSGSHGRYQVVKGGAK